MFNNSFWQNTFNRSSKIAGGSRLPVIYNPNLKGNSPMVKIPFKSKLSALYQNIRPYAALGTGIYQGAQALQNANALTDARRSTDDLESDITAAALNNPSLIYDLSPEQQRLLRQVRRGTYGDAGISNVNLLGALGNAATGAAMGSFGGPIGALIGGVGGLVNSGLSDVGAAQARNNEQLEALYNAVVESNQNYNNMRKQRAYAQFM